MAAQDSWHISARNGHLVNFIEQPAARPMLRRELNEAYYI